MREFSWAIQAAISHTAGFTYVRQQTAQARRKDTTLLSAAGREMVILIVPRPSMVERGHDDRSAWMDWSLMSLPKRSAGISTWGCRNRPGSHSSIESWLELPMPSFQGSLFHRHKLYTNKLAAFLAEQKSPREKRPVCLHFSPDSGLRGVLTFIRAVMSCGSMARVTAG